VNRGGIAIYVTLCRRSELVALLREDLAIESDGFGTVTIRRSKADQEGEGTIAAVTPDAMRVVGPYKSDTENSPTRYRTTPN
jgi:hypothetical protein